MTVKLEDITNSTVPHATRSSEPTIFEMVSNVNTLVGNLTNSGWEAADHQIRIIESEFNELKNAIAARDLDEVRDGIVDVVFTANGLAHRMGMNADEDFADMMVSQMTKFDTTEEDAQLTIEKYAQRGLVVEVHDSVNPQTGEAVKVAMSPIEQQYQDRDEVCPKGKWLKSHKFQEPVFRPLSSSVMAKLEETK